MLYLINQDMPCVEMDSISKEKACQTICDHIEQEDITYALDKETSLIFNNTFHSDIGVYITSIESNSEFKGLSPDDVVVTLEDNLELGDIVISINISNIAVSGDNRFHFKIYNCYD